MAACQFSSAADQYAITKDEHLLLSDGWSEPSYEYEPDFTAMSNKIANDVLHSLQPAIDAYDAAKEPELALWQAALTAFDGKMEIPSKKTIRCYTVCKDYQRILILSSSARYEVYKHYVPKKGQFILFYVKHHISSRKTISDDLCRVIDATFLPHCYKISELIQLLDSSCTQTNVDVGIWANTRIQQAWSMHTVEQMLAIPILDGQPSIIHKHDFEDVPCLYITLK